MIRTRLLVLGCTLAFVVACSDGGTMPGNPALRNPPATPIGPQFQELRGVVEMLDDVRFGLRQTNAVVVTIRYFDTEALMTVLGREVILRGTFTGDGDFSVSALKSPKTGRTPTSASRRSGNPGSPASDRSLNE